MGLYTFWSFSTKVKNIIKRLVWLFNMWWQTRKIILNYKIFVQNSLKPRGNLLWISSHSRNPDPSSSTNEKQANIPFLNPIFKDFLFRFYSLYTLRTPSSNIELTHDFIFFKKTGSVKIDGIKITKHSHFEPHICSL